MLKQTRLESVEDGSPISGKSKIISNREIESHSEDYYPEPAKLGTFQDSKNAPIHRWFQYPAGFSYKAVDLVLNHYQIKSGQRVYDPFTGSGTTIVGCKYQGIESVGIEAHPFVIKIARTKVKWDYDMRSLTNAMDDFIKILKDNRALITKVSLDKMPELVKKCYSQNNLKGLVFIRDMIKDHVDNEYRDLFEVALMCTLRKASGAATGWPYIAPKKKIEERDGLTTFFEQLRICITDINQTPKENRKVISEIIHGDSRKTSIPDESCDFAFTSPPYLNNYDYADRTRLESYFMGYADTWADISDKVRSKLIMSATTQVSRNDYNIDDICSPELKEFSKIVATKIQDTVSSLSKIRVTKGGKKSYDILVGQYFNDMTLSIQDTYRILKDGSYYLLILGDSAPYGIHVPTEQYLAQIGLGIGFKKYKTIEIRQRGNKWKGNPQRHHVLLRESFLILKK